MKPQKEILERRRKKKWRRILPKRRKRREEEEKREKNVKNPRGHSGPECSPPDSPLHIDANRHGLKIEISHHLWGFSGLYKFFFSSSS